MNLQILLLVLYIAAAQVQAAPVVGGYVTSWTSKEQVEAMPLASYTHLFHAFVKADAAGNLSPPSGLPAAWLVEYGHQKGCLVLVSLGGGGFRHFNAIAGDAASRERFIQQVVQRVLETGYDGVDLDWEFPDSEIPARNWAVLVQELRAALTKAAAATERKTTYLLTAAVSGAEWAGRWLDGDTIRGQMDFLNVMCYDFAGQWGGRVGPHAALFSPPGDPNAYSIANSMRYWHEVRKIPASQLVVGIPFYSYIFADCVEGERLRSGHGRKIQAINWRALTALIQTEKWEQKAAPERGTLVCSSPDGRRLAGIDTPEIVGRKTGWALDQGFGGVFVWELSQEKPSVDDFPLTMAIRSAVEMYLRHRGEVQPSGPAGGP